MKTASSKPLASTAAERQARKKKRILIVLAAVTLLTWSRSVLGEDAKPAAATTAGTAVNAGGSAASAVAATRPLTKAVANFEQATERMRIWPAAIERRVIEGAIGDLSPAYWLSRAASPVSDEQASAALVEIPEPERVLPPAGSLSDVLPLRLRSTALLGSQRYAVIGNTRYSEGDRIEVAGLGEFLLETVRSREVVLRQQERTWTLSIQPTLPADQDSV